MFEPGARFAVDPQRIEASTPRCLDAHLLVVLPRVGTVHENTAGRASLSLEPDLVADYSIA